MKPILTNHTPNHWRRSLLENALRLFSAVHFHRRHLSLFLALYHLKRP